jgi:transposase-like protein
MYSEDQKKKAIELYLKYGRRASAVMRELGYPNRLTLRKWFYECRDNGYSHKYNGPRILDNGVRLSMRGDPIGETSGPTGQRGISSR